MDKLINKNMVDATNNGIRKIRGKFKMKKINMFNNFDCEGFFKGKRLMSIGQQEWKDFKTGDVQGTKVEVVIAQDKTNYGVADGEVINNMYEKLSVKVPMQITVPMNVEVKLINPTATIYGDYRDKLSVTADNIEVVSK